MKHFLFILALWLHNDSRSSTRENFVQELLASKNLEEIKSVYSKYIYSPPEPFLNRPLEFGFSNVVWECELIEGNYFWDFRLTLILEKDSIVYGELAKREKNRLWVVQGYFPTHHERIQELMVQYNSFYDTNYRFDVFNKVLTQDFYYSMGCGETGNDLPLQATQMLRWVETRNIRKLFEWMKSPNFELQAYALDGLTRIQKKGIQLENNVIKIIDHLKRRNSIILHCAGCIQDLRTPLNNLIF